MGSTRQFGIAIVGLAWGLSACGPIQSERPKAAIPHLELEMDSLSYQRLLLSQEDSKIERPDQLDDIVRYGARLLNWVQFLNSTRDNPLELTSPETQQGFPIEEPRVANVEITEGIWNELYRRLPAQMKNIVVEGASFEQLKDISDRDFVLFAREVNMVYQRASRWILQEPYLTEYAERASNDIRGYYFLDKIPNKVETLKTNWPKVADADMIRKFLVMMCVNSGKSRSECRNALAASERQNNEVLSFYNRYLGGSRKLWNSFFVISNPRRDAAWTDTVMTVPFMAPSDDDIKQWLTVNIEDEWKFGEWQLRLKFKNSQEQNGYTTRVRFVPGVTPNVNGLGGSIITMDANQPLQDYNVRWTIRHEYGHTLGFPDCYAEFYDTEVGQMISYQLDITNLMCSRRGNLQKQHFDRLKSAHGAVDSDGSEVQEPISE